MPLTLTRPWKHYGLRTSNYDGKSHGGFQWPETGIVEAPDWNPKPKCGGGLHALLNGEGYSELLSWHINARWQLVGFDEYVSLGEKVKFPRCEVATGSQAEVTQAVRRLCNSAPHGLIASTGSSGILLGGDYSKLTGGCYTTLIGGRGSNLTAGHTSTLLAGDDSTLIAGEHSKLVGGNDSNLVAGTCSVLSAKGRSSTLTGGEYSALTFHLWEGERRRAVIAYTGEGGIKPYKPYRCVDEKVVPA